MIFSEDQIYLKSSKYSAKIIKKFLNRYNYKLENLVVLDFGCGPCTMHRYLNFKKTFLYDKEYFSIPNHKKNYFKYKNYESIFKNRQKYNLIIVNSVIQYINPNFLHNLLSSLNLKLKKNGIIFLGDIPQFSRLKEFISCTNLIKIFYLIKYFLFKKKYFKKILFLR